MVKIELQFSTVAEAAAFLFAGNAATGAAVTLPAQITPEPAASPKPKKEAPAPKPDAKPQADSAASGAQTATASDAASAPSTPAVPPPTYEKSGIGEKINGYVGAKDSEGYAARRGQILALLEQYKVANAKALPPDQFAPFLAALNGLKAPEPDLG